MKMGKDSKVIFELHSYLDIKGSPKEAVEEIVKSIPNLEGIGFAGCLEKDWLKVLLKGFILDKNGNNQHYLYNLAYEEKAKKICEKTIEQCKKYINGKVHIFLFPTFDEFVIKKMGGANGFSSWNSTILIFINFVKGWEESLNETIVHELAHAVSPFYMGGDFSIGYGLVLEGIAEHFREFVVNRKRAPWTRAISEEKSWEIFNELRDKDLLKTKDFDKYNEVFYGAGKYPNWTGYTIGYHLINEYLKKQNNIDWKKLLKENPEKILKET